MDPYSQGFSDGVHFAMGITFVIGVVGILLIGVSWALRYIDRQ